MRPAGEFAAEWSEIGPSPKSPGKSNDAADAAAVAR